MMFKNFPVKYDAQEWLDLYRWAEKEHNLPEGLLTAIAVHGEKTNADRVSSAGARTPLQIIPDTRNSALRMWDVDAYSSPQAAAWVAGRLLRDSMDRNNGDVGAAVREYQGGTNRANWGKVNQAYHDRVMAGWGGNEPAWYQDDQQGSGDLADMVTDARNGYQNELTDAENYLNAPDIDTLFQQGDEPMTVTITGHAGSEEPQDIMSVLGGEAPAILIEGSRTDPEAPPKVSVLGAEEPQDIMSLLGGEQAKEKEESPVIEAGRETLARYKDGKMDDAERRAFELAVAAGEVTVPQDFQVAPRVDWRKVAQKGDRRSTMETIGDTAQDIGAGIAGIIPAAIGGVGSAVEFGGNLVGWEGAEKLGKGVADVMSATAGKINENVGSDYSNEAQAALADMMDDDTATADDVVSFIMSHKAAIGREALTGIGSMLMPMGMAGAAGKLAKARKASKVAEKLARVFGASAGSGAMMAGGEYHDARNEGLSAEDARDKGLVAGGAGMATGLVLGKFGMNPEANLAARALGSKIGRAANPFVTAFGEGTEEAVQNLANDVAQTVINGEQWDWNRSKKEATRAFATGLGSGAGAGYAVGRMQGGGGVLDSLRNAPPGVAGKAMEWLRSKNNNSQLSKEQIQAAIDNMTRAAQLGIDLPFGMALDNKNLHAFLSDVMTRNPDMAHRTGLVEWVDNIGGQLKGALSEKVAESVDPLTAGAQWNTAVQQKHDKMQSDYRELYQQAKDAGDYGRTTDMLRVNVGDENIVNYLAERTLNGKSVLDKNRIATHMLETLKNFGCVELEKDGKRITSIRVLKPILSVEQIQDLKGELSATVDATNSADKFQAKEIRGFLAALRKDAAGDSALGKADVAYKAYQDIFGDQSTSLWTDEKSAKNSSDKVADSQVVDKFMEMTPEDIRKNFAILEHENHDAVQQIRGGIMARIMANAQSADGSNKTRLNGDRLAAEVKKLDKSGQLDAIFGEQNAQNMRDISAITNIVESVRKHHSGEVTEEQISNLEASAMDAWKKFNSMKLMFPIHARGTSILYSRFNRWKNERLINNIIKGGFGDDTQAALTKALGAGVYDSPDKASARPVLVPRSPLEGTSDPYRYDQPPSNSVSGFDMGGTPDLFNQPEGNDAAQQQAQQQAQQELTASIQDVLASVMELARDNPELAQSIEKIINGSNDPKAEGGDEPAAPAQTAPEQPSGGLTGHDIVVGYGDEDAPARWEIVEADDLAPTMGYAENQTRDRTRAASKAQIDKIAGNLNFRRVSDSVMINEGAPTLSNVAQGSKIIGGNGRTAAIKQAYAQGSAGKYRQELVKNAERFGFDPAVVEGMRNPVLIRRFVNDVDVNQAARASNESGQSFSNMELARSDAEAAGDMLRELSIDENGKITNSGANREIIGKIAHKIGGGANAEFLDSNGGVSPRGMQRVENALLFNAYGGTEAMKQLVDEATPDSRNVVNALIKASGAVASLQESINKGHIPPEYSLSEDIDGAISLIAGRTAAEVEAQAANYDLYEAGTKYDTPAGIIAVTLSRLKKRPNMMANFLRSYVIKAKKMHGGGDGQEDMFGQEIQDKYNLLKNIAKGIK